MAKKRKAVKKARKSRPSAKSKTRKPAANRAARKAADEGFFAAFLKLFAPPETKGR
jgi:hypothetical protein